MSWHIKLILDGVTLADVEPFDAVHAAIQAGNSAIRNGLADDVTVSHQERNSIYYQFSTIRTASEEQRIGRMLEGELVKIARASSVR